MINQIQSAGPFMSVSGVTIFPYINNNGQCAGQTRWNTTTQSLEVYDGSMWHTMSGTAYLDLTTEATELLMWVRKKRDEEQRLDALMSQHPGLKDAYEKFEIMKKLVQVEQAPV